MITMNRSIRSTSAPAAGERVEDALKILPRPFGHFGRGPHLQRDDPIGKRHSKNNEPMWILSQGRGAYFRQKVGRHDHNEPIDQGYQRTCRWRGGRRCPKNSPTPFLGGKPAFRGNRSLKRRQASSMDKRKDSQRG